MKRVNQSVERLLAQTDHPEFRTTQGRVLDEARNTLIAIAKDERPKTVLGGLMVREGLFMPNALDDEPRSKPEIAANAHISPVGIINNRGETIEDVLADLVEVGWVECTMDPTEGSIETIVDGPVRQKWHLIDPALVQVKADENIN